MYNNDQYTNSSTLSEDKLNDLLDTSMSTIAFYYQLNEIILRF